MLIKPPSDSNTAEALYRLGRDSYIIEWLEQNRQNLLELLAQVPEEPRFRQLQGAAVTLNELIALFTRTP